MAGFYEKVFHALPNSLQRRIHPLDFAIRRLAEEASEHSQPGDVVLDAGAGESRFEELFKHCRYLTVDTALGDSDWDYSAIHVLADLSQIPLKEASIDLVLNTQVLEHVPDPGRVIREFYRVLKPGGKLFLSAPQGWHEHQQPCDFFRFTTFSLQLLFREAGFRDHRILPQGGYFHYLGHRLTYIPKVLFQGRSGFWRYLLFPVELLCLGMFCFLLPLGCYFLDRFDGKKEFTLGYACRVIKPASLQPHRPFRHP